MKRRHGSYILAVLLLTAVPVVADRIPCDFTDGSSDSEHFAEINESANPSGSSTYANFSASTFNVHEFRNEFNPAVEMSNSGLDGLWNLGPRSSDHQVFDLGYNHGNAFGRGHDKARGNRDGKNRDDDIRVLPLVVTPEPGSTMLLLIGLAGLGMIVYRRNALKNAI